MTATDLRSRRSLLTAAAAAVAGAALATVTGVQRVFADGSDGEPVLVGGTYDDVRTTTSLSGRNLPADRTSYLLSLRVGRKGGGITADNGDDSSNGSRLATLLGRNAALEGCAAEIPGVWASSANATGIEADGWRGGQFYGYVAALRLIPGTHDGPPSASGVTGASKPGDLYLDSKCRLWLCKGKHGGWVKVA